MDNSYDSHLDLDDRRDELMPTLRPPSTTSTSSFNKSFLFQHNTSSTTSAPFPHSNVLTLLLRNNQLTTMSPYANALYEMHHSLRELTLRNNAFTRFPPEILVLTNLTSLSLAKNQIQYIGLELFPQLSRLNWLSLSHNQLESLPDDLASCRHLLGLDLSSNNFKELPPVISQLSQLQVLLIQKNELSQLPDGPEDPLPPSLQTLNLAFNQFDQIPDILVTKPPPSLTHLHLSGNALGELPPDFLKYGYKNLVSLDLHTCQLSRVSPLFFTYLDQTHNTNSMIPLRRLNLAINQLRELPSTIGLAIQLQWLNLNDNRLTTLPATMSHLVHLAKLGLVQNHLRYIPPYLFSCMLALEKIDLRRNQLSYLPPSILSLAPEHEIQQHIDLAVPVTVFESSRVSHVPCPSMKLSDEGQGEGRQGGGGSLKTLLLYENIHLEQKDGIFVALEYDKEDDEWNDGEDQDKEARMWVPLISLEQLRTFSIPAVKKNAASLGQFLQQQPLCAWTVDSHSDDCHEEAIQFFYHHLSSLKNIALQQHLAHQQLDINIDNGTPTTTITSTCCRTKSTVATHHSQRLDLDLEMRHAFLSRGFPSWFPCLLHQKILSDAQQCDNCFKWTTVLPFQVGYLARLCNNRMQVPVRYTVCSARCALDATLRIQATADNWRAQSLNNAPHLPIPTTTANIYDASTLNNDDDPATLAITSFSQRQDSINNHTNDQPQQSQTLASASTLAFAKNDLGGTISSTSSQPISSSSSSSPSARHDYHPHQHNHHEDSMVTRGSSINDQDSSNSTPSLTRVFRRFERLAASLIHCGTPQPQYQVHTVSSTSSQQPDVTTQSQPPSLTPLHRPTYPTTSTMIQRLSQLPIPPALSQNDILRLTDPRPTLTSFNHLPRDAIRLERF